MIRLACESDFDKEPIDETAIRIHSLRYAYGIDVPFIQFYTDGEGSLLSIMDGVGLFSPCGEVSEEWVYFLAAHSDIRQMHCSAAAGQAIATSGNWNIHCGTVLRYETGRGEKATDGVCCAPHLPSVYNLLSQCFTPFQAFDGWYVDVSHRVRHGCCHIASILDGRDVVSSAMTVAETQTAAILGQVATAATHRRRGYAAKCINHLIDTCKEKELYILPINETAEKLYISLGFAPCGAWAELTRA